MFYYNIKGSKVCYIYIIYDNMQTEINQRILQRFAYKVRESQPRDVVVVPRNTMNSTYDDYVSTGGSGLGQ